MLDSGRSVPMSRGVLSHRSHAHAAQRAHLGKGGHARDVFASRARMHERWCARSGAWRRLTAPQQPISSSH